MSITVVCPYGFLGSRHDDFACQSRTLLQLAVYQYVSGMLPSQAVHDVWAWHDVSCKMNTLVLFFRGKLTLSRSSTDVMGPGSFEMFGMLPFSVLRASLLKQVDCMHSKATSQTCVLQVYPPSPGLLSYAAISCKCHRFSPERDQRNWALTLWVTP